MLEHQVVRGVVTQMGIRFFAPTVVLTVGTFLAGKIYTWGGELFRSRAGDPPSISLATSLRELPFRIGRLKQVRHPVFDGKSIDFQN